jgi:exopolysaccharide biosynthesis polyprenyl glycosylphosphotransferase
MGSGVRRDVGTKCLGGYMRRDAMSLSGGGRPVAGSFSVRAGRRRRTARQGRDKAPWYVGVALTADVLGTVAPVLAVFTATGRPGAGPAALVVAVCWTGVQAAHRRYEERALGESRGLLATLRDFATLLGVLALLRTAAGDVAAPLPLLLALVPAPLVTGACRALTHRHLTRQRREAQAVQRALVVGETGPVDQVVGQLAGRTDHAYVVIGAVTAGKGALLSGAPRVGRLHAGPGPSPGDGTTVLAAARAHRADLVLVVPGATLAGERLRHLSWAAQDAGLPLVVASGLTEVALRRVRASTAAGLHLLHVAPPPRRGPQLALKAVLDRTGAALGLLLLAPLLLLVAAAVRLDSRGPALHRQIRVGHGGTRFTMWKFRSMVADAEALRPALAAADEQDGPMFKIRRDPRVTRVGRLLRRTSLDELPQLVNVLRGEMSLVGPRPPLPEEVAAYDPVALRRLLVKPGVTGLWQVGGRSDLSWDESLALDLRYTDNWSVTTDLDVLARTFRAVVEGRGAY